MTHRFAHTLRIARSGCIIAGLLISATQTWSTSAAAADLSNVPDPLPLRVQSSVTINDDVIRLRDIFVGEMNYPDKAIAQSPQPGQRVVLSADWLASLARTNGLSWRPTNVYDRAIVFRPGQTVAANEIMNAVKKELMAHGMPENFGLKLTSALSSVTIGLNAEKNMAVREVFFDGKSNTFSALVELPAGDPRAYFISVNGSALPVVTVPVLKQALPRDTVITADMIETLELPEDKLGADAILDTNLVVGLATRNYTRSGQALRESDLHHISLVSIPVLRGDMRRGSTISEAQINWIEVNANQLAEDTILETEKIVGLTPKRFLAAGTPIRNSDVQVMNLVEIPVAARDIRRGITLTADDLRWTVADTANMPYEVIEDESGLVGLIANQNLRAGQPFRQQSVSQPIAVTKGKLVTLIFNTRIMTLTAKAKVLENGAIGQVIRIINTKSNTTLFAEVVDAETVRVTDQQTAMN